MKHLGMLALGIFVGTIITLGVTNIKDWTKLRTVLTTLLGAALSGAVFSFIQYLGGQKLGDALFYYPVGLVLGMMWIYIKQAVIHIQTGFPILGWLHIAGTVIITMGVLLILFSPEFRNRLPDSHNEASNQIAPANGSEQYRSETNQPSPTASSRR